MNDRPPWYAVDDARTLCRAFWRTESGRGVLMGLRQENLKKYGDTPALPDLARMLSDELEYPGLLVTKNISDLVFQGAQNLPADAVLPRFPVLPYAFCVFDEPISLGVEDYNISACAWAVETKVDPSEAEDLGFLPFEATGMQFTIYSFMPRGGGLDIGVSPLRWPFGEKMAEWRHPDPKDDHEQSLYAAMDRQRAVLLSLMLFLEQPFIGVSEGHVPRAVRRRMEHHPKAYSPYKVVSLRRLQHRSDNELPQSAVAWSYQWLVRGHWRNQPCGPAHADRKVIWVNPYVKGPEDKPLKVQSVVYAAVR